jgi:hypothetical protein
MVRDQSGASAPPTTVGGYPAAPGAVPGQPPVPPPPPPDAPLPRIECGECEFSFIVGDIAVATCPNCGAQVRTGRGDPEEE